MLLIALSACVSAGTPKDCPAAAGDGYTCRVDAEPYPRLLVAGVDAGAPILGRVAALMSWRRGYLADQMQAWDYLLARVQPLDLVIVNSSGKVADPVLPGSFVHVTVYLGDEADLRRAGVWQDEAVRAHAKEISAGGVFIESDFRGVHLSTPKLVFDADRAVVLRPSVASRSVKRTMLVSFFRQIGTRFDYHFDADSEDALFCAELANRVLSDQNIPFRQVYGRTSILPDDIVGATLDGTTRMKMVTYVRGRPGGWETLSADDLRQERRLALGAPERRSCD